MKLKELPNTVVHVPTQEEYDELMKILEDGGWGWLGDKRNWGEYGDKTCVRVTTANGVGYTSVGVTLEGVWWYTQHGYRIITLKEFKKEQGLDMDYKQGDVLVDKDGNKRKILGVCGEVYHISRPDDFTKYSVGYTKEDLDSWGYTLYTGTTEDIVEVTLEEVAKLKKVDVSKIRIKG